MKKVIGIDIGGTSINAGIVDENGRLFNLASYKTAQSGNSEDVIKTVVHSIEHLLSLDNEIVGVGIGSPGFVDSENGQILSVGGNIKGWSGTPLKVALKKYFDIPIQIENDANVAALCENWIGAAKNVESFVMITLGTGLGGGIYYKSHGLVRGQHFQAGELGHSILYPNGRPCSCGQLGCAERYISGSAIELNYFELTKKKLTGEDIFKLFDKENYAKLAIDEFSKNLAYFLVTLKNILDPELIVIGGGLIKVWECWWDFMINSFNSYVNDRANLRIEPALLMNEAGVIGAGKAILDVIK